MPVFWTNNRGLITHNNLIERENPEYENIALSTIKLIESNPEINMGALIGYKIQDVIGDDMPELLIVQIENE